MFGCRSALFTLINQVFFMDCSHVFNVMNVMSCPQTFNGSPTSWGSAPSPGLGPPGSHELCRKGLRPPRRSPNPSCGKKNNITWKITPWKINMEHTNHPFRKENDLPNLHDYVPCRSSGVYGTQHLQAKIEVWFKWCSFSFSSDLQVPACSFSGVKAWSKCSAVQKRIW